MRRKARITGKVESDRRVRIDRASHASIKPVLAELKASPFVELAALAVSDRQRQERFPSHPIGKRGSWRHFPNILHVRGYIGLSAAPQYGGNLHQAVQPSGQKVSH